MKSYLLLLSILAISAMNAFSQQFVSTIPEPRNVVLEEFTGIYCGYCPQGHTIANQIKTDNPGRVVLINIHEGGYAVPSQPTHPDFRTPWGPDLVMLSKLAGYPAGQINREHFQGAEYQQQKPNENSLALGRGGWTAAANKIFNSPNSPVNVAAQIVRKGSDSLYITVEAFFTEATEKKALLNIAILESGVIGYQASGGENYVHNHILRDLITGQWGDVIAQTNQGAFFTKTYGYKITSRIADPADADLDIAVFVTNEDHETIYTGVDYKLPKLEKLATLEVTGTDMLVGEAGKPVSTTVTLTNISSQNIEFLLSAEKSTETPSDWSVQITSPVNPAFILAAGESKDIEVSVTTSSTLGIGLFKLIAQEVGTENGLNYKASFSASSAEITAVQIISAGEESKSFKTVFQQRNHKGIMDISPENFNRIAPYLNSLELIVFNGGISGTMSTTDQTIIMDLYKKGVKLFICGAQTFSSLSTTNQALFGIKYNGYSTQGYGSSPWQVWLSGVADDPISDKLGQTVEGNLNKWLISLMQITDAEKTFPIMHFKYDGKRCVSKGAGLVDTFDITGPEAIIGIRAQSANSKAVILSFHPSIIRAVTPRNDLIDNTLIWLKGAVDAPELPEAPKVEVYPNPANNELRVSDINFETEYSIYSITGMKMKSGMYKGSVDINELSAGVYYININGELFRFIKN